MNILNNENIQLKDLICVYGKIIPIDICDFIIKTIEKKPWLKHSWTNLESKNIFDYENNQKELDMQESTLELHNILSPFICESLKKYIEEYFFENENTKNLVSRFSTIRFNRYQKGQIMRQHCDHIISLFEGKERGIPVLSVILNLNDNYSGGNLYFWEDYKIPLGKGDIVIFPSLFLFPHGVSEVTEGTRYSAVSWIW